MSSVTVLPQEPWVPFMLSDDRIPKRKEGERERDKRKAALAHLANLYAKSASRLEDILAELRANPNEERRRELEIKLVGAIEHCAYLRPWMARATRHASNTHI
jgi:hypothetical protein